MEPTSQYLARRMIWSAVALATAAFLVAQVRTTMIVSRPAVELYQAVEAVPEDKIIILSCNFEPGTWGENGLQTTALVRHLFRSGKRFAIMSWTTPVGAQLGQQVAEQYAPEYGRTYGQDWVNWGFKTGHANMIRGLVKDIPGTIKQDLRRQPLAELPLMDNVRSIADVGLVIEVTPSASLPVWVRFVYGIYRTPLGYACTGVMAPEAFPYYDAGQIVGVLKGLAGAAEYEQLVGYEGEGLKRMPAQSSAHALVLALMALGNIIHFRARRRGRAPGGRASTS